MRGRGGLYQQLRRAPSPICNASPPRQQINPEQENSDTDDDYDIDDDDVFMFPPGGVEEPIPLHAIPHDEPEHENNVERRWGDDDWDVPVLRVPPHPQLQRREPRVEVGDWEDFPLVAPRRAQQQHQLLSREELIQLGIVRDGE